MSFIVTARINDILAIQVPIPDIWLPYHVKTVLENRKSQDLWCRHCHRVDMTRLMICAPCRMKRPKNWLSSRKMKLGKQFRRNLGKYCCTPMWRDCLDVSPEACDNQRMVRAHSFCTFELSRENHLPCTIRGTKSGRTSSGMDAQEGGIMTSSHVTEFARRHQRNPAAYTDFSCDNRHWFRIKQN